MTTILHVIPTLEGGGAERQLSLLAAEQASRGWDVHVALRRGGIHEERVRRSGAVIHALGDLRRFHPLLVARVGALVRRLSPHVVQTWLPQMDIVAGLVAVASSIPWVLTERTTPEAYRGAPAARWMRQRLGRRARAVVANSTAGARYWTRLLGRAERVSTVRNALDLDAIAHATVVHAVSHEPLLLFVGRLASEKAPEVLVDALARMPERQSVRAMFIGDGPLRHSLEHRIAALGLTRVTVLPFQSDWWGLLKGATVLVSPSRYEGHPNVVLEAMAAGCPLIVSDIPAHREVLDESSATFVRRDDPGALAREIGSVLANATASRERAARARCRVVGLTIQHVADAYEVVYSRVLVRADA